MLRDEIFEEKVQLFEPGINFSSGQIDPLNKPGVVR